MGKTVVYVDGHFEPRDVNDTSDVAFIKLSDAPTSYSDNANKLVRVKETEDGLEFATIEVGGLAQYQVRRMIRR